MTDMIARMIRQFGLQRSVALNWDDDTGMMTTLIIAHHLDGKTNQLLKRKKNTSHIFYR